MKRIVFAAGLIVTLAAAVEAADLSLTQLTWLAGDWQQTTPTAAMVEEHWSKPTQNGLIGVSRTVRGGKTVAFEFLRIEQRDTDIFYVAQPGGRPPTDFRLVSSADGELVFEGDGKDRVNRITYRRQGPNGLLALVEGEESGRSFRLEYRYSRAVAVARLLESPRR